MWWVQYELVESIGKGTYGEVFKYTDRSTGRSVAVKTLRVDAEEAEDKDGVMDGAIPSTAVREISLLKELNHDNIVRWGESRERAGRSSPRRSLFEKGSDRRLFRSLQVRGPLV